MFIKNIWYACAWEHEVKAGKAIGRIVTQEPVVLWRNDEGELRAFEDRCPHRHAPLSMGRVEGNELRCMYHGMKFSDAGQCIHIPGTDHRPSGTDVRAFPVAEKDGWIWVWPGDPDLADTATIPDAWGLDPDKYSIETGAYDYEADYRLLADNLCDLSHIDFVHESTLRVASAFPWSEDQPKIRKLDDRLRIERWSCDVALDPSQDMLFDVWNSYDFVLPGLFIMNAMVYPAGTAKASDMGPPAENSPIQRVEQQSITPTTPGRCRYLFASGAPAATDGEGYAETETMMEIIRAAFLEDKDIIEAQQRIWDLTEESTPKAFLPQDQAPAMFRRMIDARLKQEAADHTHTELEAAE